MTNDNAWSLDRRGGISGQINGNARHNLDRPLRVVHLAQSDSEGGANRAAYRLHMAISRAGVESTFHCGRKFRESADVVEAARRIGRAASTLVTYLNARPLKAFPNRSGPFSPVKLSYGQLNPGLLV